MWNFCFSFIFHWFEISGPAVIEELLRKMKEKGDEVEKKYTDQLKDLNVSQ